MYLPYLLINPVTNFWNKRTRSAEASKTELVKLNVQQALESFLYLCSIIDTCFKPQFIQNIHCINARMKKLWLVGRSEKVKHIFIEKNNIRIRGR